MMPIIYQCSKCKEQSLHPKFISRVSFITNNEDDDDLKEMQHTFDLCDVCKKAVIDFSGDQS